jgi:hypothetical protein
MDLRCGLDGDFQNRATSKSSMFRFGFSIINHPFGVPLIFETSRSEAMEMQPAA